MVSKEELYNCRPPPPPLFQHHGHLNAPANPCTHLIWTRGLTPLPWIWVDLVHVSDQENEGEVMSGDLRRKATSTAPPWSTAAMLGEAQTTWRGTRCPVNGPSWAPWSLRPQKHDPDWPLEASPQPFELPGPTLH